MGVTCSLRTVDAVTFAAQPREKLGELLTWGQAGVIDIDKAWDGITWLLSSERRAGDTIPDDPQLLETRALYLPHFEPGCNVMWAEPAEAAAISGVLERLDAATLREHFDPTAMNEGMVYPENWDDEPEYGLSYLLEHFQLLRDAYRGAAQRGDYVLLRIE
jgi:hypothetical protein